MDVFMQFDIIGEINEWFLQSIDDFDMLNEINLL